MTPIMSHDNSLIARPEHVLHAAVAYTRPEFLFFDAIIALHSANALHVSSCTPDAPTLLSLPPEVLLRVRTHLQSTLTASVAADSAAALRDYESALIEGLCPDCYWWNVDVYGADVWAWVENGYRGACNCCVFGDVDPRVPSPNRQRITRKFQGLDIASRGQWLRAHLSRTYLQGESVWRITRTVLHELGCEHRFHAVQASEPFSMSSSPSFEQAFADQKKAEKRAAPCDYGALVTIFPSTQRAATEEAAITLKRVMRELDIRPVVDEEPSIVLEGSAARFVEQIYKRNACDMHFRSQRSAAVNCFDCLRTIFAAPSSLVTYAVANHPSRLSRLSVSIVTNSALATGLLCAVGVACFAARVVF